MEDLETKLLQEVEDIKWKWESCGVCFSKTRQTCYQKSLKTFNLSSNVFVSSTAASNKKEK